VRIEISTRWPRAWRLPRRQEPQLWGSVARIVTGGEQERRREKGGEGDHQKAIFALNISILRSKGYWFWRHQGRVTRIAGEHDGRR